MKSRHRRLIAHATALVLAVALAGPIAAAQPSATHHGVAGASTGAGTVLRQFTAPSRTTTRPADRIIVKYRATVGATARTALRAAARLDRVRGLNLIGAEVVRPRNGDLVSTLAALRADPRVEYAVADDYLTPFSDPASEPLEPFQWGLRNSGQTINGFAGVADVDIDGTEAWTTTQGDPSVVVAVIDDGVDFAHPDLAGQAWINPGESGLDGGGLDKATNGVDDDGNGFIDDVNGWDFCNGDASLHDFPEDFHGTMVSGVIAAAANGSGIAGVAPGVRIMGLKFLVNKPGCGTVDEAVAAIEYAHAKGAQIINASWGGSDFSQPLKDAIDASGALFVAAAGNDSLNLDLHPVYPAAYTSPNILTVASIHNQGGLSDFSNYGRIAVDVSAPGDDIVVPFTDSDQWQGIGWGWASGTSFSAPHVSGVAALVASIRPDLLANPVALRKRILDTSWYLAPTAGLTATGRVVDARDALDGTPPVASAPRVAIAAGRTLGTSSVATVVAWSKPTDAGSGIGSYALERRAGGGGWARIAGTGSVTSAALSLAIGTSYEFRIRATDRAGNTSYSPASAAVRPTLYQEGSARATYRGTWHYSYSRYASGGRMKYATRSTAKVTFSFTGRGVALVAPLGSGRGSIHVYVDGVFYRNVSLHSATTHYRQVVLSRALAYGQHSLKLIVAGTAGHPRFNIDAIVVLR